MEITEHIQSLVATVVLGAVLMAIIYHAIVYTFIRDYLVYHYILFLLSFGLYVTYVSGIYGIIFGEEFQDFFRIYLAEGTQMLYLFFYNVFIMKAMNVDRKKNPLLFWLWNIMIWSILLYGVCITAYVILMRTDYHASIFFPLIRLVIFSIAFTLVWFYIRLKPNLFQKIIFYGAIVYLLFGFISSYTNYAMIFEPLGPIEWLVLGGFIDIIFFSGALNFRIRKTIFNLNRDLLNNANDKIKIQEELIQKQRDLDNERRRIAVDMHDDLGSGLTKINYLAQMSGGMAHADANLEKIKQTSSDLIENMSNIIWAMKQENDSLQDLVNYIKIYAAEYLETNGIDLKINVPEIIQNIEISGHVRRNIFLVIKEILHNMVKHSKTERAEIEISITQTIKIRIEDFGVGFNRNDLPANKGNGLGNMKYRVEKLNGEIILHSSAQGTSYVITIPLQRLQA